MYWILTTDEPDDEELALIGRQPDLDYILGDFLWVEGTKIYSEIPTPLEFTIDPDGGNFIPALFDDTSMTLMNAQMLKTLKESGVDNFQQYEALIYDKKNKPLKDDYYAVNIIGRINCVDLEKSKYESKQASRRLFFIRIIIDESKTNGALFFRLNETPSTMVIHDTVKKRLEEAKLPGLDFIKASE